MKRSAHSADTTVKRERLTIRDMIAIYCRGPQRDAPTGRSKHPCCPISPKRCCKKSGAAP